MKKKQVYQGEYSKLQELMIRTFNELIGKVNQNAALLPRELINYAKHYVLKARHELEEAILTISKS